MKNLKSFSLACLLVLSFSACSKAEIMEEETVAPDTSQVAQPMMEEAVPADTTVMVN